ncbi:MAG: putative tyrosine recombinase XerC-like protein [Candidatus Heimdallarchaeota archaeon LC_2]|nr:MAG: putative tyrosine recombinase XerC-like protein [Candidatus Heimdallarchaeota archaeon LC_2]
MNNENLKNYSTWLKRQRFSENTVKNYPMVLNKINLQSIDAMHDSLTKLASIDADKTFNNRINSLKKLADYLEQNEIKSPLINEIRKLNRIKNPVSVSHPPYTLDKAKIILNTAKGWRRQALWIAFNTGARQQEIEKLNVEDIILQKDQSVGWIHIKRGKNNKSRDIAILDTTPLKRWKRVRELANISSNNWLFTRSGSRPNLRSGAVLEKLSKQVGFKVNWHRCRATYATIEYEVSNDVKLVQEQLGHASSATTDKYIQRSKKVRLQKIIQRGKLY